MCSSSLDDALACWALLQLKLQALSSGLGCGERDRHTRFTHPSPATSCCREGWWRAAHAVCRCLQAQLLPFPPKSAVAPLTQPQHFLQLFAHAQQMGQGSQPALDLTKNCWIAVPSITHPSGAEGPQQHPACPLACPHAETASPGKSFCRNTLVQLETQHLLSAPPLRLLSHWQGWKEVAPSAKGTPGWTRTPCSFSQAVPSSMGLTAPRTGA